MNRLDLGLHQGSSRAGPKLRFWASVRHAPALAQSNGPGILQIKCLHGHTPEGISPSGRPDWGCSWGSFDLTSSPINELGSAATGENHALTLFMADDGNVTRHYLLEGIVVAVCGFSLMLLQGKP